jgi:cytochrome c553
MVIDFVSMTSRLSSAAAALTIFSSLARGDADLFEKSVRPVLAQHCQTCHDAKVRMGGLDLTTAETFARGDVAGRLLNAIRYGGKIRMPPTGKLEDEQIAALAEWVRQGAQWPSAVRVEKRETFWSFEPPRAVTPPAVRDEEWAHNEIDRFLLARLEQKGLRPAPDAAPLTLLRRATFDLTGLPPSEAEAKAFLADRSPDAYERLIERLLASPHYGEHWGRHWLDVARYADSTGADEDHKYPHAWRYRDYVVDAFNRDLPYDRFVTEQIAGDLLPAGQEGGVNTRGIVATGFLALGPKLLAERDKKKAFYDIVDEQIDVVSRALLGLSLACARCHDHKFDPLSMRDYYSMAAIFASTKQLADPNAPLSTLYFAPLAPKAVAARYEAHLKEVEARRKAIDQLFAQDRNRRAERLRPQLAGYMLAAWRVYAQGADAADIARREGLDEHAVAGWVKYLKPAGERLPHLEPWHTASPGDLPAMAEKYQSEYEAESQRRASAKSEWEQAAARAKAEGRKPPEQPRFYVGDNRFFSEVNGAAGPFAPPEDERERLLPAAAAERLAKLRSELAELARSGPEEPPLACAVAEGEPVEQHVFLRGNWESKGPLVRKGFPAVLAHGEQPEILKGSGRRELAAWLTSREHPLVARVMVNRIWQGHFGEGIVRTPSNFGRMGEPPTHPDLLDWLARQFQDSGWSVKAMHRLIMRSRAYRMSSTPLPEQRVKDPGNRLWSRFQRRRLAAEEIRDSLLALDGALDRTAGGPLQKLTTELDKPFTSGRLSMDPDSTRRRSLYLTLRRPNLPGVLALFDFVDSTTSAESRAQTNVAPQALYLMNSPFAAERATSLARRLLADPGGDGARVEHAYWAAFGRGPRDEEIRRALDYVAAFPEKDNRAKAWTSLCHALLNSSEFLYVR